MRSQLEQSREPENRDRCASCCGSERGQYKGAHIPGFLGLESGLQAPPGLYVGNVVWISRLGVHKMDQSRTKRGKAARGS
jgi:hypothetical protein